jgi:hypothetical protein
VKRSFRRDAPHDCLTTSVVSRISQRRRRRRSLLKDSTNRSVACSPNSIIGTRTEVRGGLVYCAIGMSSKPVTATSSGTETPASRRALNAPIAIESFAAKIAVGRCDNRASAFAARYPPVSVKSPSISNSGSSATRAALSADR